MAHLKLILAFFALVILCAGVLVAAWFYKHIIVPEQVIVQEIEVQESEPASDAPPPPDLGRRQFVKAVEMLEDGELLAAREQLYYVMEYYPDSATYPDAKRIVGEINLDLVLSELPIEGKTEYVVQSGDALSRIARDHRCTINYIMRVNGRTTDRIFKGDRLTVFPLDQFAVSIDISDQSLRVEREGRLFKEYAVTDVTLPPMVRAPVSTTVSSLVAYGADGELRQFDDIDYLGSTKWIATGHKGLLIRGVPTLATASAVAAGTQADSDAAETASDGETTTSSSGTAFGVMVAQEDIEELFAYLRGGTPVRLTE